MLLILINHKLYNAQSPPSDKSPPHRLTDLQAMVLNQRQQMGTRPPLFLTFQTRKTLLQDANVEAG